MGTEAKRRLFQVHIGSPPLPCSKTTHQSKAAVFVKVMKSKPKNVKIPPPEVSFSLAFLPNVKNVFLFASLNKSFTVHSAFYLSLLSM